MARPTDDAERLDAARRALSARGVDVLYEDHLLLFVSKAAGVLSQRGPAGEDSLVERIGAYRRAAEGKPGRAFVGLVHRLDRNVSGVLVVAKSSKAASRLSAAFRSREGVEKDYLAWVAGSPRADEARISSVLERDEARRKTRAAPAAAEEGGAEEGVATLSFSVAARGDGVARLRVRLHTGATHQIRAQLALEGLPLLGDPKYGGPEAPTAASCARPALHAWRLRVPHPVGGAPVAAEAPVPRDLARLDRALRLDPPIA